MDLGKQYEILVYERSRVAKLDAQRNALKLPYQTDEDRINRLDAQIAKVGETLNNLAQLKDLCD